MVRRLFITTLVWGVLSLLGGMALGYDDPGNLDRIPIRVTNPDAPLVNQLTKVYTPSLLRPPDEQIGQADVTLLPPLYYCDYIDYSGGNFAYYIQIPSGVGDFYNMRFDEAPGYKCTLLTASVAMFTPGFIGTPDLKVIVWDDDGYGLPGTELANIVIPYASIPPGAHYVSADFSGHNLVFEDGENYFVGVTSNTPGAKIALMVDDGTAGTGRSNIWLNGVFYNRAANGMTDFNFGIGIDICCGDIPYEECYRQQYNVAPQYYYSNPNSFGVTYFNTRFSVEGPETLVDIGIALLASGSTGYPDLLVEVYGDNAGFPDLTDPKFSSLVPYASIHWYPDWTEVPLPAGTVMRDDFHLTWSPVGIGSLAGLLDDCDCGVLRSSASYYGGWITLVDLFGEDNNWLMYADLCRDEFSTCGRIVNYCDPYYLYSMPSSSGSGRIGGFEKIEPFGAGCRLEEVRIATTDNGLAGEYQYTGTIMICPADIDDNPDVTNPIAIKTIGPDQSDPWVNYPGFNTWDVLSLNIVFDQPLYIGLVSNKPTGTPPPDYYLVGDDDACDGDNAVAYYNDGHFARYAGSNFLIDAYACCIPGHPTHCPGDDWPTAAHDFRRTGASGSSTGDAQCRQALSWMATDAAGVIYGRPIIYNDIVLQPYNDKLRAYDINNGTMRWTFQGLPYIGTGFRNSVTVKNGFIYFGGGNGRSFTKANVYNGPDGIVWSRNVLNNPLTGSLTYTTSVTLDCGGTDVVFFATDAGALYALDAATGADYAGWAVNPIMLDGQSWATLSSNGSDMLYIGTDGSFASGEGTLYAINACTGAIEWQRGYPDLAGDDFNVDPPGEIFQGPIAVDYDGSLYVTTAFNNLPSSAYPSGAYYKFSPEGNIVWAKRGKFSRYTGPVVDANLIYFTTLRGWTSEDQSVWAVSKMTGATIWISDERFDGSNWVEGALSCATNMPDFLYQGNTSAQLLAINADDGSVSHEYNYVATTSPRGCGVALDAAHLVFNNRQGDLYVFTNQADRPRLRILTFDELQPVPFFAPPHYTVHFHDVFMNNGCANLLGTLTVDANPPPAYAWTVNPQRINRFQNTANGMVKNSYAAMARHLIKSQRIDGSVLDAEFTESPYAKNNYSNTDAYGPPPWLNGMFPATFNLAPGATFNVAFDVNAPLVSRGPHRAYVTIHNNDQYFLNSDDSPVIQLGVLGGCLQTDDAISFGTTEQNLAPVFNTGETGNQNGAAQWTFDGESNRYWQGGLFFAADIHRLAWTTDSWHGADPPDFWNSLLPDPNCLDQCEPYVTSDPVWLGKISKDGGHTYANVEGYASVVAYIDSVVNFDCYGSGWDWANVECPFDNTLTMGLRVEQSMYGAINVPALNNVVIFRHDVTNRNITPVTAYMGAFHDFDLDGTYNTFDTYKFDAAHSISWGAPCTQAYDFHNGVVYGTGKIPMNSNPMIGVRTCDANQAMWHAENVALDSLYIWMTTQPGRTAQAGIDMNFPCDEASASDDRDMWASYIGHTYGAHETYSYGTYIFGYPHADVTDDQFFIDLAILVNKFAGFGRGDVNNDGLRNLADGVAIWNMVNKGGPGPLFMHSTDVNGDGATDNADVLYMYNFCFCVGPAPVDTWALPNICP